jgi:hypothetical protein
MPDHKRLSAVIFDTSDIGCLHRPALLQGACQWRSDGAKGLIRGRVCSLSNTDRFWWIGKESAMLPFLRAAALGID